MLHHVETSLLLVVDWLRVAAVEHSAPQLADWLCLGCAPLPALHTETLMHFADDLRNYCRSRFESIDHQS